MRFRWKHSSKQVSGISTRTMHQSTTPSLLQTIWPRWASRHFLSLLIVQALLPVTFGYSLSLEAVIMRQLRRWKGLWQRSLTHSHKRISMGPEVVGTVEQVHCSWRRLFRRGLEFYVCTINKSAHTKKVRKLIVCISYVGGDRHHNLFKCLGLTHLALIIPLLHRVWQNNLSGFGMWIRKAI